MYTPKKFDPYFLDETTTPAAPIFEDVCMMEKKTIIKSIIISNITSGPEKISLFFIPKNVTTNFIPYHFVKEYEILENDVSIIDLSHVLEEGDIIKVSPKTFPISVVIHVSGVEVD